MKLTCDLCNGELQMNPGGQQASCTQCGLTYSLERLKEKMTAFGKAAPEATTQEEPSVHKDQDASASKPDRNLRIHRKMTFIAFTAQVYLDGKLCATLKNTSSPVDIPVSQGDHEILIQVTTMSGTNDVGPTFFRVGDRDWDGVFYIRRRMFGAEANFEMRQDN